MSSKDHRRKRVASRRSQPAAEAPAPARRAPVAAVAGIVLLTLLTFAPVRHFDFVHFDDFAFVVENPHVATGLTLANLAWAVKNPYSGTGGPVTWLSHMVDVEIFGLAAGGHHLTSLIIHTLSAVLLLLVLHAATGSTRRSAFVAALFAVHPLHVESVAWIAERKDVLSALFWFAATGAYVAYVRRSGGWRYAAVVGLFVLGLFSKPMVVTLPFVLLLMDVWPLRRLPVEQGFAARLRPLVIEKIPLLVLGALAIGLTFLAQRELGAVAGLDAIPISTRLPNAIVSYVAYLGQAVWPVGLIPYYPYRTSIPIPLVAAAAVLLLSITVATFATFRRAPFLWMGWLWYVGTLVPVIGLVQVGGHAMADRFTYLPLTGIFIALAWGAPLLLGRINVPTAVTAAAAVLAVAVLAVTARAQTWHWENGLTLWEHTVRVDPANARAWSNLGVVLAGRHRLDEAGSAYETSLRLQPGEPKTLTNLGLVLEARGRTDAAAQRYAEAVRVRPDYFKPRMQLAGLMAASGRIDQATEHYREAVRFHPHEPLAQVNLAVALGQSGRPAVALPHMIEAIRLEPRSAQWRYFAGVMMLEAGQPKEAIAMLESALQLDPDHQQARATLQAVRTASK